MRDTQRSKGTDYALPVAAARQLTEAAKRELELAERAVREAVAHRDMCWQKQHDAEVAYLVLTHS